MRSVPAIARHRYDAAGERVFLVVRPSGATLAESYELTPREARRLAWGLLADLSPDEIDLDLERAAEAVAAAAPTAGRCICGRARSAPQGKAGQILRALATSNLTARQAADLIARDTSTASAFIVHLVSKGYAEKVAGGLGGAPTVYAISPAGRVALGAAAV